MIDSASDVYAELWISLASVLRSYTAAHGIHNNRHATVEATEQKIMARFEEKWLSLNREGAIVTWTRENGSSGSLVMSEAGQLRTETSEEEMDMAAEAWARELMQ
ncbi:MAG: transcriptional regulator [Terracidiphilus sp.]